MAGLSGQPEGRQADASRGGGGFDFAAHYEASYRVLWVIAASIAGPPAAADIVHQAAVQALSKLDQFQPGSDFTAWMSQIVRYIALNHVRSLQRHRAVPLEDRALEDPRPRPVTVLSDKGELANDQQHFDDELVEALNGLSETARACLLLRTVQGLSYADIAATLDIPEGTAMSHVHRSRQQLRARLQHRMTIVGGKQDTQG